MLFSRTVSLTGAAYYVAGRAERLGVAGSHLEFVYQFNRGARVVVRFAYIVQTVTRFRELWVLEFSCMAASS